MLKKVHVARRDVTPICRVDIGSVFTTFGGGTWNDANEILFAPNRNTSRLYRVTAEVGATPEEETEIEVAAGESGHADPFFLPDGVHYLFRVIAHPLSQIYMGRLGDERRHLVQSAALAAQFSQDHLLFVTQDDSTLMAQRFGATSGSLTGEPVPLAQHIATRAIASGAPFSVSESGVLAYQLGEVAPAAKLVIFDRNGDKRPIPAPEANYEDLFVSPDGTRATVSLQEPDRNVYMIDLETGVRSQFTFGEGEEREAPWSPDGTWILVNSDRDGPMNLFRKNANGSGSLVPIYSDEQDKYPQSVSVNGDVLFMVFGGSETGQDLWLWDSKTRKASALLDTRANEVCGQFSPDGNFMAYTANGQVWVRSVRAIGDAGGPYRISESGGSDVRWQDDEIFFRDPSGRPIARETRCSESGCQLGATDELFQLPPQSPPWGWDVGPGGQEFLVVVRPPAVDGPVTLDLNWHTVFDD